MIEMLARQTRRRIRDQKWLRYFALLAASLTPGLAWAQLSYTPASLDFALAQGIAVGDFNEDGLDDIAATFNVGSFPALTPRIIVFLSAGDGSFSATVTYNPTVDCWTGGGTYSAAFDAADVNNDGHLDLILGHGGPAPGCVANKVTVHLGDGAGGFGIPGILFQTAGTVIQGGVGVGDFDEDGNVDLLIPVDTGFELFLGLGNGSFVPGVIPSPNVAGDVVVRDFDRNGHLDFATAALSGAYVFFGLGNGLFAHTQLTADSTTQFGITSADVDRDGDLDVVTTADVLPAFVNVFENVGGGFAAPVAIAASNFIRSLIAADLDGNGAVDLAVGRFQGEILALLGDGAGRFDAPIVLPADQGASLRVRTGDFDGDGKPDIVSTGCNGVCVLLSAGPTVGIAIDIGPGSFPNSINVTSKGVTTVAVLGTESFDVSDIAPASVRFAAGQAQALDGGQKEDINGDSLFDLVFHFRTQEAGISCGDTSAVLIGKTHGGKAIKGSDSIKTVPCR